jgi:RHH-type proline utilization regulon transcriptional repressor/proline dehydrogenase/delta 1-pyrroline-5-carboxylate dehydrogenase
MPEDSMPNNALGSARQAMRQAHRADESAIVERLVSGHAPDAATREKAVQRAARLVEAIRSEARPGLMEVFLAEYGLSTDEGIALMCLAEALLRVPDAATIDELIEDKIAPSQWGRHLGHSNSPLVNASTWALMLTGKVLDADRSQGMAGVLRGAVKRLGEPVIRTAVRQAMKELGSQFVLGETIESAMHRGSAMEAKGYNYSYDMLGEAALTAKDAADYFDAYASAIGAIAGGSHSDNIRRNPGISVKLSALHPRYEVAQSDRVMKELVPRVADLAAMAAEARMGFNIDAEEADRLDLSLDVIEAVLSDERLAGWDGFGVVVQAYGKRAAPVIDWLHALAEKLDRRIMVRLVKGAYWDTEIKRAQIDGVQDFPVFTRKAASDVSYICCARKLLGLTDRIYPQFATHNAHSVAAILEMAEGKDKESFEFQRLHGMGEALHRFVLERDKTRCRIYAPVGAHRDLLAYLVRRLLENGANSSFVNQIVDENVPVAEIVADPFVEWAEDPTSNPRIRKPADVFQPERGNSKGFDLRNGDDLAAIETARGPFRQERFRAVPAIDGPDRERPLREALNPADPSDIVGDVADADKADVEAALETARDWSDCPAAKRAEVLRRAADLYEEDFGAIFALLAREAGKTQLDAVGELREAVDFLHYYANQAENLGDAKPRGVFACISPWNFPLAIFTGQIAAALAAGNCVVAKPAEQTPLIAARAVALLHEAGVPRGVAIAARRWADGRRRADVQLAIDGYASPARRRRRRRSTGRWPPKLRPKRPLIAETGGLNAMIVDSTALPEQAVRDILASAFQSRGPALFGAPRCFMCRPMSPTRSETMLLGAMDELRVGDPWHLSTDVGPVIDAEAKAKIDAIMSRRHARGPAAQAAGMSGCRHILSRQP